MTTKNFSTLRAAVVGLALALGGCAATPRGSGGPLAGYPASPALSAVAHAHADAANDPREDLALLTSWFLNGDPKVAMMCRVRPDGRMSTYTYVYDESLRNPQAGNLVPDQMSSLSQAIAKLPPSQHPALENLLLVSFRSNGTWATRTYDRTSLPPPVAELFDITGAPIEPKPQ